MKRFLFYALRWQSSTLIMAPIIALITKIGWGAWIATSVANLVGACIFFWIDKFIFKDTLMAPLWEIREEIHCEDCNELCRGYRLIKSYNYDRTKDKNPEFRCEKCSAQKYQKMMGD